MSNLGQREPQPAGLTHERQQPQHVRVVVSVAGRRAPWRLENPSCFVQPERFAAEAAARRDLPDEQSVARHEGSIALTPRGKVKGALCGAGPHAPAPRGGWPAEASESARRQAAERRPRSSGTTSPGCGYRPSIDFVNTSSPSTWTSKMLFAPGTTSTTPTSSSHSSRMRATRPVALGRAPQGTQYSIRRWWRSAIGSIQPRGVRPPSGAGRASFRGGRSAAGVLLEASPSAGTATGGRVLPRVRIPCSGCQRPMKRLNMPKSG